MEAKVANRLNIRGVHAGGTPAARLCMLAFAGATLTGLQAQGLRTGDPDALQRKRTAIVTVGSTALVTGALIGLNQAWYSQYERVPFHTFNDGDEWRGMDKLGHLFSAYTTAQWGAGMFNWAGADPKVATWVGGSLGWVFLAGVEVLDGYSEGWGFSPWDMLANTAGAGLYIGQELGWGDQRFRIKYSAHLTDYAEQRPDLLGEGFAERLLKDYNGQTYWLCFSPVSFMPVKEDRRWPSWLNIAFGYGAEGMTSASADTEVEGVTTDPNQRRSQFYCSLDIDLHRIPAKNKFLRTVLDVLNCIKVPAPALEFDSNGMVRGHWLYF